MRFDDTFELELELKFPLSIDAPAVSLASSGRDRLTKRRESKTLGSRQIPTDSFSERLNVISDPPGKSGSSDGFLS
jgi:hypothetical protein